MLAILLLSVFLFSIFPSFNYRKNAVYAADAAVDASEQDGYHEMITAEHAIFHEISGILSRELCDFELAGQEAYPLTVDRGAAISIKSQLDGYPFAPFCGEQCAVITAATDHMQKVSLTFQTEDLLDSNDQFLFFAVNLLENRSLSSNVTVTLQTPQGQIVYSTTVFSGDWNGIFVPLDHVKDPSRISSLRIEVAVEHTNNDTPFSFAVDTFSVSSSTHPERVLTFLTDHFYSYGSSIAYTEGNQPTLDVTFFPSTAAPFIESFALSKTALTDSNAIRLSFEHHSNCTSVSLYYTTDSNPLFTQDLSYTLPIDTTDALQTLDFYLGDQKINQLRLVFNGASEGSLTIQSITPISGVFPFKSGYGQITSCRLTDDGDTITIRGSLSSDALEKFSRGSIYLYVLSPWEDEHTISFSSRTPLRQTSVGDIFSFSIPRLDTTTDRICSKFAIVIVFGNQYYLLDDANYISNPEILAAQDTSLPVAATQKGIIDTETDYLYMNALQYGITQTVVNLSLSDLITVSEPGYRYDFEGDIYYFDHTTVAALDDAIMHAYCENIAVYLNLQMNFSGISELNATTVPAFSAVQSYGFCIDNSPSLSYLRAAASFLAERYATNEGSGALISGVIVGNQVDRAYQNYYIGRMNLSDFVACYETAYRVFYNTMRSISPSLAFYISVSGEWDSALPTTNTLCYDSRTLLDAFAARISLGGQISWNLAFYLNTEDDFLQSDTAGRSARTIIDASNLELLCEHYAQYFSATSSQSHSMLLLSDTPVDLHRYAYTMLKLSTSACKGITGYIVMSSVIEENEEAYMALDTDEAFSVLTALLSDSDFADWNALITSQDEETLAKRIAQAATVEPDESTTTNGSYLFADFSSTDSLNGWSAGYACTSLRPGETYLGNHDTLFASMRTENYPYASVDCRFSYPHDLSVSPYLRFSAYIVMLPEGVHEVSMTVILRNGSDYVSADYTLRSGMWNQIYFDASAFSGIDHITEMRITIQTTDGVSIGDPTLILTGIRAYSDTLSNDELMAFIAKEREQYTALNTTENEIRPLLLRIGMIVFLSAALLELIHILVRILSFRKRDMNQ